MDDKMAGTECIEKPRLARFLRGETGAGEGREIRRHLARCDACLDRMMEARREIQIETARAEPVSVPEQLMRRVKGLYPSDKGAPGPRPRAMIHRMQRHWFIRSPRLWAAAALAVLAVGLSLLVPMLDQTRPPAVQPTGPVSPFTRGAQFSPEGTLSGPPRIFRWPEFAGATQYIVELYGTGSDPLWKSDVGRALEAQPAAGVVSQWPGGQSYRWRVVAFSPTGEPIGESPLIPIAW